MTEPIKLESICPSCGKTDKLLWPEGCPNVWHTEGMVIVPQERIAALEAENARLSAPVTDAVMEELAAMEHERWSSQAIAALTDMTDARRERWTRQARLLYVGLTEAEKEQDRQQVRKTLTILAARKGAAS